MVFGLVAVAAVWVVRFGFQKTDGELVQTVVDVVSLVPGPSFVEAGATLLSRVLYAFVLLTTVNSSPTYAVFFPLMSVPFKPTLPQLPTRLRTLPQHSSVSTTSTRQRLFLLVVGYIPAAGLGHGWRLPGPDLAAYCRFGRARVIIDTSCGVSVEMVIFFLVPGSTPTLVPTVLAVFAGMSLSSVTAWRMAKSRHTCTAIPVICTGGVGDLGLLSHLRLCYWLVRRVRIVSFGGYVHD